MTTAPEGTHEVTPARRALRRAALLTSGAGIAFGVLTIVSWFLMRADREALAGAIDPAAPFPAADFGGSTIAGLYLLPIAAILFLWFIVALRGWIRRTQQRRNLLISDVQLVSGVTFVALFLVASAAVATSVVVSGTEAGEISTMTLRALSGFGNTVMVVMGVRMAAVFVIATASLGTTTGVLPRWFSYLSYGFGLLLILTPLVEASLVLAFPIWVIVLSVMLLFHLANVPEDQVPGFAARYAIETPNPAKPTEDLLD